MKSSCGQLAASRMHGSSLKVALLGVPFVLGGACSKKPADASAETAGQAKPAAPALDSSSQALSADLVAQVASRTVPAVVSVASTRVAKVDAPEPPFSDNPFLRRFFGSPNAPFPFFGPESPHRGERIQRGIGSGVIVGKDVILTNAHVVDDAKELEITAQGKRVLKAKVVGTDTKSDLAVLKIEGDASGLTSLNFADSSRLRLGQIVLAIGNPFGVGQTVTMGIVSATSRTDLGIEAYEDFIQTDAAINPGNSGGALVDLEGNLVGVPTAILSRSGGYMGVGFAIPSNMARPIMQSLLEHGHVARGFLGITIQEVDSDLAKALKLPSLDGVLIADVNPGGPADKARLRRGDVVVSIDGHRVQTTGQLRNLIASSPVGKEVTIEYLRDGQKKTVSATLTRLPDDPKASGSGSSQAAEDKAGLDLRGLDPATRRQLDVPADMQGVVVAAVAPNGPADDAGLRAGDVILQVDGHPVASSADFSRRWSETKDALALLVFRDGHTFFAAIKRGTRDR